MPIQTGTASGNDESLIPMGHSIGIKMDLSGVFITNDVLLGKDEWLKAGDLIGQVGDVKISKLKILDKHCHRFVTRRNKITCLKERRNISSPIR